MPFVDRRRHIAELIFYMEELRAHVRKYGPVMQRYYVQYLSGFDAVVLNELVQVRLTLQKTLCAQLHGMLVFMYLFIYLFVFPNLFKEALNIVYVRPLVSAHDVNEMLTRQKLLVLFSILGKCHYRLNASCVCMRLRYNTHDHQMETNYQRLLFTRFTQFNKSEI